FRSSPDFWKGGEPPGRWDTCPYVVRDGRTPLLRSLRIELLGSNFVGREDLFSSLLLARFLVAQSLKFRKGLFLLGLVAQHPCTCESRYHATSFPAFSATAF